jgi:RNA polymerase sigma-70 factor, ECF subfamily
MTPDTDRPERLDEPTFAAVWSEHAARIEGWLRVRVDQDAADLCQDVFLKAWRIREQYDPARGPVIAWLHTIAASVAADHFRALGRRPSTVDIPVDVVDDTDVAAQVCDQIEATTALERVPARDRELLARRYLAEQPVAQVAADLGMAAGTVKSRCHKAIAALRTALGVVAPLAPRIPEPTPAVQPVTIPAARSATVATLDPAPPAHHRRAGRSRVHLRGHRCPVPATDRRGETDPARHPDRGAAGDGSRRHSRHHPIAGGACPAPHPHRLDPRRPGLAGHRRRPAPRPGIRPLHQRHEEGGVTPMTMTVDQFGWAALPWMLAILVMYMAITWALIVDDGKRTHRRRHAEQAMRELGWTRYAQGRSTEATQTTVIDPVEMPTAFLPRFLPDPPPVDPDSPVGGEVEGAEPEPEDEPMPAARAWPVPELLPQPDPGPVAAVLFEATGPYPVLGESVLHSGMTGVIPRIADEIWAGAR